MQALLSAFRERFPGEAPIVVRAPGRVNLIGEHTDYNDGYVLPIAIERDIRFACRSRADRRVRLWSVNFNTDSEFELDQIELDPANPWSNYVRGVAAMLLREGLSLRGMDAAIEGNIPVASGLSSSAAMEIAAATAFQAVSGFRLDPARMALLAQRAEHEFMGVRVGIMDQFISRLGQQGHALLIDCRTLEYRAIPIPEAEYLFVVADSRQSRELAASAYNERRAQCEAAARLFQKELPDVRALRDVTSAEFRRHSARLPLTVARRARHVVHEDERVLEAVAALENADLKRFGALMNDSHESLRFDYEVSSEALDVLVAAARQVEGCLGSRLTGAGFGGCTVSLVHQDAVDAFRRHVSAVYQAFAGKEPYIYVTRASAGAGVLA
ncbi:MAG: galactokinase [Armatimonadetes bacterium]|nr:galactokinase [Armatimonadota bacterium]